MKHVGSPKPAALKRADELCSTFTLYVEARGGEVGLNSCEFRRVQAETKRSAWDEMEAEPWPTGSSSPLRLGRNGQTKSLFWKHFQGGFVSKPPTALSPWQEPPVRRPISPESGAERARQPSPASPPNMSGAGEPLRSAAPPPPPLPPPSKHGCLFKEKPQKRQHVEPTCRRPL